MSQADAFEERHRREEEPWMFNARAAELIRYEWICDRVRHLQPRYVLDVGCSLGQLAARLADLPLELHSIDVSPTAVARAQRALAMSSDRVGRVEFTGGSATALPYASRSFDVVVASDGLYSWEIDRADRMRAMDEIHRTLKPGGTVIFTEHMRMARFETFIAEIAASPLEIVNVAYLYDRPWYQFESWFKAIPNWPGVKALRRNTSIARLLARVGRLFGPRASRHICVCASRRS